MKYQKAGKAVKRETVIGCATCRGEFIVIAQCPGCGEPTTKTEE